MKKIKANRRSHVRARKRAQAAALQRRIQSTGFPGRRTPHAGVFAWVCTDPNCVEGIHHSTPTRVGDSPRTRKAPGSNQGPSSDTSDYDSEGAFGGNSTPDN